MLKVSENLTNCLVIILMEYDGMKNKDWNSRVSLEQEGLLRYYTGETQYFCIHMNYGEGFTFVKDLLFRAKHYVCYSLLVRYSI